MSPQSAHRPPFDPELGAVLSGISSQLAPVTAETLPFMREMMMVSDAADLTDEVMAQSGLVRTETTVEGYDGAEMTVSVISRSDHEGRGPGIYHIHGGGMMMGHRLTGTLGYLSWIVDHDAVLVTAEYRLAPEFPDPYPVEDCYAGLMWMSDHADSLGIDEEKIVIAGASAGGGLSAGVALLARDRKGPRLLGAALTCPMLDDSDSTVSASQFDGVATTWDRASNRFGWESYLGDRRCGQDVSIYAAPARAEDLRGLPATYIDCGSTEVFRDEDVAYATALWAAGVPAELHVWAGGFHGFELMIPHSAVAQASAAARNDWFARLLGS